MSADSPRRLSRKGSTGHVVLPQPVSDPSIIDSVAGFIHEVIPQAYSSVLPGDSRESIVWARFEQADYNDPSLYPEAGEDCDSTPPLLLVLGYSNGVQVWSIGSSGEAVEVLSWNQRVVRTLRFLPSPHSSSSTSSSSSSSPLSDPFAHKRPLIALVDNSGPPPHFSTCSFISLQAGDQVKSIKFKNPICDVLANRRSIVVTFVERIAVFDAATLEDRLTITTCYPSPGVCPNPVALGPRWLAFADKRLVSWWRSVGGCDEGGAHGSYTASVLHAAKSLGKGLRGLSAHLTQTTSASASASSQTLVNGTDANATPGVVTVIDIQGNSWQNGGGGVGALGENIVAHFVAHHMEPLVALAFDPSGMLLLTVDKRGHRFHLFRIQPHLSGSSMSEVHQLYTLYRGDTTARIQDVAFSCDSRWVAVSSMRGTTHIFPITPYGGSIGVRTHTTPHVVNKLSRFHRSAGLSERRDGGGRNSPVGSGHHSDAGGGATPGVAPPLTPPLSQRTLHQHPHSPVVVQPLAQLRRHQPMPSPAQTAQGSPTASGDCEAAQVRVAACFGVARAALPPGLLQTGGGGQLGVVGGGGGGGVGGSGGGVMTSQQRKSDSSIYVMSAPSGALLQYDLEPRHIAGLSKDRVSDDTAIELLVDAKAEWLVMWPPLFNPVQPPLAASSPLLQGANCPLLQGGSNRPHNHAKPNPHHDEHWLSQVEIVTHAGPHRRLWMGPQFTFKTYSLSSSDLDKDSVEVGTMPVQSNPINVPMRPPLLIESGSTSSLEQSPHLTEVYQNEFEFSLDHGESRLREDLADAMQESPNMPGRRWSAVECGVGGRGGGGGGGQGQRRSTVVERRVNPLGTIIMVQPIEPAPHQASVSQHSTADHLIVVAAESKPPPRKNNSQISNNNNNNNRLEEVATKPNNNKERRKNAKNDRKSINDQSINDRSIGGEKSINVDRSTNCEKSTNVEKSKTDKLVAGDKSKNDKPTSGEKASKVEKPKTDKSPVVDRSKNDRSIISDKLIGVDRSKIDSDISIVVEKSKNVEKPVEVDRSSVGKYRSIEKSTDVEKSINLKSKNDEKSIEQSIVSGEKLEKVEKLTDIEKVAGVERPSQGGDKKKTDESIITEIDILVSDSIVRCEEELRGDEKQIIEQNSDSNVGSGGSRAARRKGKNGGKKTFDEVEKGKEEKEKELLVEERVECVDNEEVEVLAAEQVASIFDQSIIDESTADKSMVDESKSTADKSMVDESKSSTVDETSSRTESDTKERDYPSLTCSSIKTKRKCRTLGKKISKIVADDSSKEKPDGDLEQCHNLMQFPDLLLANVKPVDQRRESIAQVVVDTIEKDNMMKKDNIRTIEKVNMGTEKDNKMEEVEVVVRRSTSDKEEETTTDKDSSDDCFKKGCEIGGGGGMIGGGGGGGKQKKKNRKKEEKMLGGGGGGVWSPPCEEEEKKKQLSLPASPPVRLSWSQIVSSAAVGGGVEKGRSEVEEGEEVKEEEEEEIQPEIISWNKEEGKGECKESKNSTEDRGSVYESCNESVDDCEPVRVAVDDVMVDCELGRDEVMVDCEPGREDVMVDCEPGRDDVMVDCEPCRNDDVMADCEPGRDDCEPGLNDVADDVIVESDCRECSQQQSEDSAEKESADSGEKEPQGPSQGAKKSRKQRKKRR